MKIETGQEIVEQSNSEVIIHPLSPELESQRIFKNYCGMVKLFNIQIKELFKFNVNYLIL